MGREEDVLKAIEVIQKAINDRMIFGPENWRHESQVLTRIVISGQGAHTVSYDPDGGRDMGNGFSEGSISISHPTNLKIQDPSVAIQRDRDAAKAELEKLQNDLEATAKKKADAQRKVDELNNKLLGLIGR